MSAKSFCRLLAFLASVIGWTVRGGASAIVSIGGDYCDRRSDLKAEFGDAFVEGGRGIPADM